MVQPVSNEVNKQVNVLFGGREPVFLHQPYVTSGAADPPSSAGAGCDVSLHGGAIFGFVGVRLRKNAGRWTAWLNIHNPDAAIEYGFTVTLAGGGGYTVTSGGGSTDVDEIIEEVIAQAEAQANFTGNGGSAVRLGTSSVIELSWDEDTRPASALVGTGGVGGTDYQALTPEADNARWALWGYRSDSGRWHRLDVGEQADNAALGARLIQARFNGFDRIAVQVIQADGAVLPWVAPCYLDDQADTYIQAASSALAAYEAAATWAPADQNGAPLVFDAGCPVSVVTVGTTSTEVAAAGALYVEVQNRTGGDLFLTLGGGATTNDLVIPDGESWYTPQLPGVRRWPSVDCIVGSGSGPVVVVEVR